MPATVQPEGLLPEDPFSPTDDLDRGHL